MAPPGCQALLMGEGTEASELVCRNQGLGCRHFVPQEGHVQKVQHGLVAPHEVAPVLQGEGQGPAALAGAGARGEPLQVAPLRGVAAPGLQGLPAVAALPCRVAGGGVRGRV